MSDRSPPPARRASGSLERTAPPPSEGGPTRRGAPRERSEQMEARILASAIEEFSEYGFAGARIERISQRAGTVDRMLYYYYGNKERLYQAVLEKIYADMIGEQRAFVTPDDPVEGMRRLVQHSWDHYESHPHLVRVLMNENLLRGKHIRQSSQVTRTSFPLVETVTSLLDAGQAQGLFRRDVSAEHVLMTIMSLGFFYISNQHTCSTWMGGDLMSPARRKAWREHICDVVLSALAPTASTAPTAPKKATAAAPRKAAGRRRPA
ncbi:TetR family transcriptional regulator [Variovorax dokdonensis]|uniref:TetR family transcriptional regulator n=1 Tax=Variovorax dokdonensis TaxID=344883 RepID=A0ABT7NAZ5_9BURK|nr:TetR family transcriptional regulator [Variovorax dokdonensis]MDM0045121.1 TetR family transcriptional regulator [Variovorax dokdonensis]